MASTMFPQAVHSFAIRFSEIKCYVTKGPQPTTQGKAYKFLKMVIFNKLVMAFAICCLEIFVAKPVFYTVSAL